MTRTEATLLDALQDAEAAFGLLEATLRQGRLEPLAEIVRGFRNKAAAAIANVSRETIHAEVAGTGYPRPAKPLAGPSIDFPSGPLGR